jgi:two-component system, OmpR family, response regulator ChvI
MMMTVTENETGLSPVLVVDDDPLFRETLCGNLEDNGYRTIGLDGGRAILEYFEKGGPAAAVLLDWQMPDVDGPAVLRQLRAGGRATPILFLTGHSQPIYEEAALVQGAVDFIDKSRSFAIILQRLKLAIGGAKTGAETSEPNTGSGTHGPLFLDVGSARAMWRDTQVDLTLTEFKVVQLLAGRTGRDVSYREIYDVVRGAGFRAGSGEDGYRANVRALVKRVRQKFRAIDSDFTALENYPGFGYRWIDAG